MQLLPEGIAPSLLAPFKRTIVIRIDQRAGSFVSDVPSRPRDLQSSFRHQSARRAGAIAAFHAPGEPPLQPDIDADGLAGWWERRRRNSHAMRPRDPSALRTMAQVLGARSNGRSACSRMAPIVESVSRCLSSVTSLPYCGEVKLSYQPLTLNLG